MACAKAGPGRMVLLGGEAGVGKTTLVPGFVESLEEIRVLVGTSDPLPTPLALAPVLDIAPGSAPSSASCWTAPRSGGELFGPVLSHLAALLDPALLVIEDMPWRTGPPWTSSPAWLTRPRPLLPFPAPRAARPGCWPQQSGQHRPPCWRPPCWPPGDTRLRRLPPSPAAGAARPGCLAARAPPALAGRRYQAPPLPLRLPLEQHAQVVGSLNELENLGRNRSVVALCVGNLSERLALNPGTGPRHVGAYLAHFLPLIGADADL